ncbi:MAG: hypothetical protein ACRDUA_09910 [Micromonosporaceae bacterium]
MGKLHEIMQDLTVAGQSPDGSVTITASGVPASIEVNLARGCTQDHTEQSLEYQIDTAVRLVMMAYRQRAYAAWRQAAGLTEAQ